MAVIRVSILSISIVVSFLLLVSCNKEVLPLDAPGDVLISEVKVYRKSTLIQEIACTYNNNNLISEMTIRNLEGSTVSETVRYSYTDSYVKMRFSFAFESDDSSGFEILLHKDNAGYIHTFKSIAPFQTDTLMVSVVREDNNRLISAYDIMNGSVINQYEYNEFGLVSTSLKNYALGLNRTEFIEYELLESYAPGVNEIPILDQFTRDGYPFHPPYLTFTGNKSNVTPTFLPKSRLVYLDDAFNNAQVFNFDYARDKQGRIIEVRKYTPDLVNDVRMKFFYIRKK